MKFPYVNVRKFEEMKDVLMDANVQASSFSPYYVVKEAGRNTTILPPIMYGSEFNKTYGHYHKPHFDEKYTFLHGEGAVLVQKLKDPSDYYGDVSEVAITKLKKGEEFLIPKGYGHILINLGSDLLITRDNWDDKNAEHEYKSIVSKRGMAYYVVKGSGESLSYVKNPNYQNLPEIQVRD